MGKHGTGKSSGIYDINSKSEDIQRNYLSCNFDSYKYWQYNSILLYNIVLVYTCDWPSLYLEWLPNVHTRDEDTSYQELVVGTYTKDHNNYLMLFEVNLPSEKLSRSNLYYNRVNTYRHNTCNDTSKNFKIKSKIYHDCEINKVSYFPRRSNLIACFTSSGDIQILDLYNPQNDLSDHRKKKVKFEKTLKGHTHQGWGLQWDEKSCLIASCADDSNLCIWDINTAEHNLNPVCKYFNNYIPLQDCCWRESTVLAVGEKGHVHLYDIRTKSLENKIKISDYIINSIDVNPHNNALFATAGTNQAIDLWDIRSLDKTLHRIISQKETIIKIRWDKYQPGVLASSSIDNSVSFFDTNKIGIEQTYEDSQDGPPELIFVHGGHTANVLDFSINPSFSMMVASMSEDNTLNVWQPSKRAFEEGSETYDDAEVE